MHQVHLYVFFIHRCIGIICKILERGDLNLRIAAGETVALVFELAREMDYSLRSGPINNLYGMLRDLANESGRHKGKREKRQQKSSFRDILKSVEVSNQFYLGVIFI